LSTHAYPPGLESPHRHAPCECTDKMRWERVAPQSLRFRAVCTNCGSVVMEDKVSAEERATEEPRAKSEDEPATVLDATGLTTAGRVVVVYDESGCSAGAGVVSEGAD
jgi:hypothetical protein